MEAIEVPPYFLCPISLQIMRDPVTLSTGITYDRNNIERWIFSGNHTTCPVTKQNLTQLQLTPNHTLRRLTQAWCADNTSNGVERFPTPRPPIDTPQIIALLDEAKLAESQTTALRKLKSIVTDNERNKRRVEASGAPDVLVSILTNNSMDDDARSEALVVLCSLQLSEQTLLRLAESNEDLFIALTKILSSGSYQLRAYAALFMKALVQVVPPNRLHGLSKELFHEIAKLLRDQTSSAVTRAALQVLCSALNWGRNRVKAAEAGCVDALVGLLLDEQEKKGCEMILGALELMCRCAEGRACFVGNAGGIAAVSKKLLRVSRVGSGLGVKIMYLVAKLSGSRGVVQEMLEVGVVSKLVLVLQVECDVKVREKVREILRMHSRVWMSSPCLSPYLKASYPC